jgi:D-sedoheptulose 7-phosphate isomerase
MIGTQMAAREYLDRIKSEFDRLDANQIQRFSDAIYASYEAGQFVFLCGNGGSGSNASHMCEDLGKGTIRRDDYLNESKRRLRVLSLTDNTPYILAWANDEGYDRVFLEQLKNIASPGDLLIAISGSGNSPNVLRAVEWANTHGMRTFGLTGFGGGKLRQIVHDGLHVPIPDMGVVESIHLLVFHWVLDNLYSRIAGPDSDGSFTIHHEIREGARDVGPLSPP